MFYKLVWLVIVIFCIKMSWAASQNRTMSECHSAGVNCKMAVCYVENTTMDYTCRCLNGYKGDLCEEDVNECERGSAPCLKRGVCHNFAGSFRCDCLPGWKGTHCQKADGSGLSSCLTGYTGVNCTDDFDECKQWTENPCEHNSTCVNTPGTFSCSCATGWEGEICNQDINECNMTTGLCHNGGNCTNIPGSYKCVCPYPYTGVACDDVSSTTSTSTTTTRPISMSANVSNGLPSLNKTGSIASVSSTLSSLTTRVPPMSANVSNASVPNTLLSVTTVSSHHQNSTSGNVSRQAQSGGGASGADGGGGGSNVGVIAGPIVGILVIAAAAVAGLFVYRKYFRKRGKVDAADETHVEKTEKKTSADDANKNTKFNPSQQNGTPKPDAAPVGNGVNVDTVP